MEYFESTATSRERVRAGGGVGGHITSAEGRVFSQTHGVSRFSSPCVFLDYASSGLFPHFAHGVFSLYSFCLFYHRCFLLLFLFFHERARMLTLGTCDLAYPRFLGDKSMLLWENHIKSFQFPKTPISLLRASFRRFFFVCVSCVDVMVVGKAAKSSPFFLLFDCVGPFPPSLYAQGKEMFKFCIGSARRSYRVPWKLSQG